MCSQLPEQKKSLRMSELLFGPSPFHQISYSRGWGKELHAGAPCRGPDNQTFPSLPEKQRNPKLFIRFHREGLELLHSSGTEKVISSEKATYSLSFMQPFFRSEG